MSLGYMVENRIVTVAMLLGIPLLIYLIVSRNIQYTYNGMEAMLYYLKTYCIRYIPGDYLLTVKGADYLPLFLNIYNMIPISLTTFCVMKRKPMHIAAVFYVPYFMASVSNISMLPDQVASETAIAAFLLVVLYQVTRSRNKTCPEKNLLKLMIPVGVIMVGLGFAIPAKGYDKDILAHRFLNKTRDTVISSRFRSNRYIQRLIDLAENGKQYGGLLTYDNYISDSVTDLSEVGFFDPPKVRVASIFYTTDNDYHSIRIPPRSISYVYLKVLSKDIYSYNVWNSSDIGMPVFRGDATIPSSNTRFNFTVELYGNSDLTVSPYYSDFYSPSPVNSDLATSFSVIERYNSRPFRGDVSYYQTCNIPLRTGDIYTNEYLEDYVYGTNLSVPARTRDGIIESGVLPDWYMKLLNGEIEMSDADKVRLVTEYVRGLHPYDADTPYPPDYMDFIVWFMTESDSGFCVHYASTAVILLRMLGVPARYVEGYLVSDVFDSVYTNVYMTDAHAWFEFFLPDYGWIMGDPTPGNAFAASAYDIDCLAQVYPELAREDNFMISDEDGEVEISVVYETNEQTEETFEAVVTGSESESVTDETTEPGTSETTGDITEGSSEAEMTGPSDTGAGGMESPSGENEPPQTVFTDIFKITVLVLAGILILLLLVRFGFVLWWERQFMTGSVNDRTIAYYRYYRWKTSKLKGTLPKRATSIAEKATFGNESVTKEELAELIDICRRSVKETVSPKPWYIRILSRLI